jgi:SAM-dependent methyltransferase
VSETDPGQRHEDPLDPIEAAEPAVANRLREGRPVPTPAFRGELRGRLATGPASSPEGAGNLQEEVYDEDSDYLAGSPHLRHRGLNQALLELIFAATEAAAEAGLPPELLEVGGGDGSITEPLLARGLTVTSTEMSRASVERIRARFPHNDRLRAVHDADGSLAVLGDEELSCILFASVLHHIPDYMATIADVLSRHLRPSGSLVTIQDPLFYPRLAPATRRASGFAYLSWRLFQGDFRRGVQTRLRRATRGVSEEQAGDAVEYHVVRDGVDEQGIVELLAPRFETVELRRYWSSQGRLQQRVGEALGLHNTFAVLARGYRGPERPKSRSAWTQTPSSP